MQRRSMMVWAALTAGWGGMTWATAAQRAEVRLATAGATLSAGAVQSYWVGVMQPDWAASEMRQLHNVVVPSRAHGLAALPDGGFAAVANRPGRWLLRCDAQARVVCQLDTRDAVRSFEGHVIASNDGQWLYTTETDPRTGQGWLAVRDSRSLKTVEEMRTGGSEPHQLLWHDADTVVVANGGVLRDAADRKIELQRMDSSVVLLRPQRRERVGQWRLADRRLGLRHMAWSTPQAGQPRVLGIALQNEHEDSARRSLSPLLAIWDGTSLTLPAEQAQGQGYAGDIAPTPQGGFLLSSQRSGRVFAWHPANPGTLESVLTLEQAGALVRVPGAPGQADVLVAGSVGARSALEVPSLLAWPVGVQVDNHWVELAAA
ncbi:DUF1513 domain-containing protein [Curvibacter sp. APW13]|uniref:DUF1513 domain-containing protein n=1 Tax=Curvibacter sp. APW13 TaxID=3077236 RepID=UPI0028E07DE9|nr:DUF1513 domain-containing protein [Curvibacter sp. APW13]MDT8992112.1 DUF1513 domain-containing protein [Curvibacter sp. APW13]